MLIICYIQSIASVYTSLTHGFHHKTTRRAKLSAWEILLCIWFYYEQELNLIWWKEGRFLINPSLIYLHVKMNTILWKNQGIWIELLSNLSRINLLHDLLYLLGSNYPYRFKFVSKLNKRYKLTWDFFINRQKWDKHAVFKISYYYPYHWIS